MEALQQQILDTAALARDVGYLQESVKHELRTIESFGAMEGNEPVTRDRVVAASIPASSIWRQGVYFLIKDGEIVYVGQSRHVFSRLNSHQKFREFDAASFIECALEDLDFVESFYIHRFEPAWNARSTDGSVRAPLTREAMERILIEREADGDPDHG